MQFIDNIPISVEDEQRSYPTVVSTEPVEDGSPITDHVELRPITFNIQGRIVGPDAASRRNEIVRLRRAKRPVRYIGRGVLTNAIITSWTETANKTVANGLEFDMTIQQIRIARPSIVSALPYNLRVEAAEVGNKGRVQGVDG